MTSDEYARARRLLMRRDPTLGAIIKRIGPCGLADDQHTDPYVALVRAICSQQLSSKAAATIYKRVVALIPAGNSLTPSEVSRVSEEAMRGAGLSGAKARYVKDLTARVLEGALPLDDLVVMDDDAVIAALTQVKGIGRWSAEMFLMFRLHRPDVMPLGDLGIVRAMQKAYGLRAAPVPKRMLRMAEAWRPYRSVACWYLWASLE